MPTWPTYAEIVASSYVIETARDTRRTEFDDGAINQVKRVTEPLTRRSFECLLSETAIADFRNWVAAHSTTQFRFTDLDDNHTRLVRIVGGQGGVKIKNMMHRDNTLTYRAQLTVEGFRKHALKSISLACNISGFSLSVTVITDTSLIHGGANIAEFVAAVKITTRVPITLSASFSIDAPNVHVVDAVLVELTHQSKYFTGGDNINSYVNISNFTTEYELTESPPIGNYSSNSVPIFYYYNDLSNYINSNSVNTPPNLSGTKRLITGVGYINPYTPRAYGFVSIKNSIFQFIAGSATFPDDLGFGWNIHLRYYKDVNPTGAKSCYIQLFANQTRIPLIPDDNNLSSGGGASSDVKPWREITVNIPTGIKPTKLVFIFRSTKPSTYYWIGLAPPAGYDKIRIYAAREAPASGGAGGSGAEHIYSENGYILDSQHDRITDSNGDLIHLAAA